MDSQILNNLRVMMIVIGISKERVMIEFQPGFLLFHFSNMSCSDYYRDMSRIEFPYTWIEYERLSVEMSSPIIVYKDFCDLYPMK
jgi:hypothetical protein